MSRLSAKTDRRLLLRAACLASFGTGGIWIYYEARNGTIWARMPLNEMSRAWGSLHSKELPVALRAPVYGTWGWFFGSRMEECGAPLSSYRNLSEFFTRSLKPGVRPVSSDHQIVSPVDGKVVNFGEVVGDKVEQIKGVTYTLQKFLGFDPYSRMSKDEKSGEKKLFFCTLYLAPGDYHRIHGSASWTVDECIHIPGRLFPVAPSVTSIVPELFATNERVVLAGKWSGGFYSLTSVGALNVGSIQLLDDVASAFSGIQTNQPENRHIEPFIQVQNEGIPVNAESQVAKFNLGSTVVLIFEAEENFSFDLSEGQQILVGEGIGTFPQK